MLPIVEETSQDFGPPKEKKSPSVAPPASFGRHEGKKSLTVFGG